MNRVKQIVQPSIRFRLSLDRGADHLLMDANRRDQGVPGPTLLPGTVARCVGTMLGDPSRAVAVQQPHKTRHTVLGRHGQEQMDVSGPQSARFEHACLLLRHPRTHVFASLVGSSQRGRSGETWG